MLTFACKPYKRYFVMKLRIFLLGLSLFLLGATVVPTLAQQDIILPPEHMRKPKQKPKPKPKPRPNKPSAAQTRKAILDRLVANMVYVEGGTFTMGATAEQGSDADGFEKPTHQVTLSTFYIGKYEVTQAEWKAVMGTNPSHFKGDNLPVEFVSWDDCQEFIRKLNELTGKQFRLPTEAEWEYAARGGKRSYGAKYAGGGDIGNVAWYKENSNSTTHPVGLKRANELGLYDMTGNVWEWCQDRYGKYSSTSQTNPQGPGSGRDRVLRGGCWGNVARYCRLSGRIYDFPGIRTNGIGLRLVLPSLQ